MDPREFLSASADQAKETVVLKPHFGWVKVVGSTVPVSVAGEKVESVAIQLDSSFGEQDEQLIAVIARRDDYLRNQPDRNPVCPFLISLRWLSERNGVNLDSPYVPSGDRMLQFRNGYLEVRAESDLLDGPEVFTTNPEDAGKPGMRYVPDGSLLCRYAIGQAEVRDLLEAASAHVELVSFQEQLAIARARVAALETQIDQAMADLNAADQRANLWIIAATELEKATKCGWWTRKDEIARAIAAFPIERDDVPAEERLLGRQLATARLERDVCRAIVAQLIGSLLASNKVMQAITTRLKMLQTLPSSGVDLENERAELLRILKSTKNVLLDGAEKYMRLSAANVAASATPDKSVL